MPLASTAIERLRPRFSAVDRARTRLLSAAGSLADAAIHRHIRELEADEAVVGLQTDPPESIHHSQLYPLVASATQRALRAALVGDPVISAAEDEYLHQLLEDYPLGDARAVAPERMVRLSLGKEGTKLLEDGLDEVRFECGHGACSFCSGSLEDSPNDGTSRARFSFDLRPY
jgi:hypothetical protein